MVYVFVDESGDAGLSDRASKYFVLACLVSDTSTDFKKRLKKVRRKLGKNKKNIPEFKFSKSSREIRELFLREILKEKWTYSAIVVEKTKVDEIRSLHEYIPSLLEEIVPSNTTISTIIVDKFLKGTALERFNATLKKKLVPPTEQKEWRSHIEIKHLRSENEAGLQIADFIAGAIYVRYSRGDSFFYDLIKSREIVFKKVTVPTLFKKTRFYSLRGCHHLRNESCIKPSSSRRPPAACAETGEDYG